MFNKQKAQFCQIHKSQICIGFCVSKNCPSNPFYCQKCLEQDHEDHKESCKEFGQITKDFTDLIKAKKSHLDKVKEKQIQLQQLGRYQVDAYERQIDELRNIQRNFSKKKHSSLSNQQIKIFKEQYCIDRQLDDCKFQQGLVNELTQMEQLIQSLELIKEDCLKNRRYKLKENIINCLSIGGCWCVQIIIIMILFYFFLLLAFIIPWMYYESEEQLRYYQAIQSKPFIETFVDQTQYFTQANDLYLKGDYSQAIKYYNKAIDLQQIQQWDNAIGLQQGNASIYFHNGNALAKLYYFELAVQNYNKALKINSENDAIYMNKGYVLTKLNRFTQAIECYDEAIKINFLNDEAYYNKGKALHQVQRYLEALESYNKAIHIKPNNQHYHNSKGLTLHKLKEYHQAIESYDFALKISIDQQILTNKNDSLLNLDKIDKPQEFKKDSLLEIRK
ncbi:unnamed protein product [Paramecium octaurelia]|uniref:Tetratricopeptide repeat protein n=1 Tax=Paramecium octaurelia TaxID=43137 RepID=A0A8S1YNI7_PAROT|nr:unnamed protein product [Paramecium octaurelia]